MIRILLVLSTFALLLTSCETIIAEDLTGKVPVLIIPSVNDTVEVNPVHFKWQEMEGATKYHLMVVSPSFSSISQYLLDTMVIGTDFFYDLDSNEYELMLAGTNAGYVSDTLGPIKFWVGTATSSSPSSVTLLTPLDDEYVNASFTNDFTWQALSGADNYEFEIRDGTSFASGTQLEFQNNIVSSNYPVAAVIGEGEYHWGVTAYFSGVPTTITTRRLYVDTIPPNQAILSSPLNGALLTAGTITFVWNNGIDPGTITAPVTSILEIATDLAFANIVPGTSIGIVGSTDDVVLTTGTYYWRVRNIDEAGNVASVSDIFDLSL